MRNFLFFALLIPLSYSFGVESFDSTRPFLKDLKEDPKVKEDFYEKPFLIVYTAQKSKETQENLYKKLQQYLFKAKLPVKGRYSLEGSSLQPKDVFSFPAISFEGKQLEGIQECKKDFCSVKLLTDTEKTKMEAAKDKPALYRSLIMERILVYLKLGELVGYEDRPSNLETLKSAFGFLPFLPARYPKMTEFIQSKFLARKLADPKDPLRKSSLRMEVMNMSGDKLQPVLRISEAFEFEENQTKLVFEPQIYTNHFFDSSMRFFEVMPYPDSELKSLVIMTDVMEVDELKKSGIIRALFKGRMVDGIQQYQADEIGRIESEGLK